MSNSVTVVASGDTAADAVQAFRERQDWPGLDAWVLCREFVEQTVGEAQVAYASENPGRSAPDVDWESIWLAGNGAASDEAAIGRIVRAAFGVAARIAQGTVEPPRLAPRGGEAPVAVGPETAGIEQSAADDPRPAPGPDIAFVGPVAAVAGPATAPFRPAEIPEPVDVPLTAVGVPAQTDWDQPVPPERDPTRVEEPVTPLVEPVPPVVTDPVTEPVPPATFTATAVIVPPAPVQTEETTTAPDDWAPPDVALAQAGRAAGRRAGWVTTFTWIRNLGIVILLFVAWQLWGTSIAQHRAQDQLHAEFDAKVSAHHVAKPAAGGPVLVPATTNRPSPPDGSVVAELQIPAIGVNQYVVEGTTEDDLSMGPGHYVGTAQPGQAGNVAIAGHRTTHGAPFNRLGQLGKGDRVILTTTSGVRLTYVVGGTPQAVSPGDVSVLNYFGDNRITLTTCNPEFSSTQRLVAVGFLKLPSSAAQPLPAVKHVQYHIVDPATASWDWSLLPVALVEICILMLLGLSFGLTGRWFGRVGKWFILVPLWAAGLYLAFGTLTSLLPSSV